MQQDAIRRVMEMQRIANERLRRSNAARAAQQKSELPADSNQNRPEQSAQSERRNQQQSSQSRPPSTFRNGQEGHPPAPVHHALPVGISGLQQNQPPQPPSPFFTSGALEGFVKRLGLETDQLILIGLLLLLINEGADTILILAVFYLLI